MYKALLSFILVVLLPQFHSTNGQPQPTAQNIIYQAGAGGSEATLLSIGSIQQSGVFGDDNELLRRIAYTETRDGTLSTTYRPGYYGGIWAVDEAEFLKTNNTVLYTCLAAKFQQIQLHYGINWSNVEWLELRKPLYSALAARLVIYIAPHCIPPADNLQDQAQFWASHYNRDGDPSNFVTPASDPEGSALESSANEFFLGFTVNHVRSTVPSLQLFVSTPDSNPVSFSVSATGFSYQGTATNNSTTVVTLPSSLEVADSTERNKGIYVKAEGERKIVVYGLSYQQDTTDAYLALPSSNLDVDAYQYYAVSYDSVMRSGQESTILLVASEDQTFVTTSSGERITLNRLETHLISHRNITGFGVTSTKPLSFFSNSQCVTLSSDNANCDHITEQLPPTVAWGQEFIAASLLGRTSGEIFRVLAAQNSTAITVKCTLSQNIIYNLVNAGDWREFMITSNSSCSIEATAPIIVVQFALRGGIDGVGDPFMMMIAPIDQYSNSYVLKALANFTTNYITIYVATQYFQPDRIFVDDQNQSSAEWTAVPCVNNSTCGYVTRLALAVGEHRLYHQDPEARVGVSVYGFSTRNSYGYPGGLKATLAIVTFEAASYRISERVDNLQVTIARSGNLGNTSVVLVASDDSQGTASAGEDYTSVSEIVEFLPGQTQKNISIEINNDMRIEDNETFQLYLIAGAGVTLTPLTRTEITIENDADVTATEAGTPTSASIETTITVAGFFAGVAAGIVVAVVMATLIIICVVKVRSLNTRAAVSQPSPESSKTADIPLDTNQAYESNPIGKMQEADGVYEAI